MYVSVFCEVERLCCYFCINKIVWHWGIHVKINPSTSHWQTGYLFDGLEAKEVNFSGVYNCHVIFYFTGWVKKQNLPHDNLPPPSKFKIYNMTKLCISNDLVKTTVGLHDRCLFKTVMFKSTKRLTINLLIWLHQETYFKRSVIEFYDNRT